MPVETELGQVGGNAVGHVAAREIEFAPGSGNAKAQLPDEPSGAAQAFGGEEQKELSGMPALKGRVKGPQPMSSGEISTVFPES